MTIFIFKGCIVSISKYSFYTDADAKYFIMLLEQCAQIYQEDVRKDLECI